MSHQNVRLQNLRDFTVQIRRLSDDKIVGTGIVVSMDGKVVTCAHVVEAALEAHPREAGDAEVGVYFPQVGYGEEKGQRASVAACFPQHDDDVVLLQLLDGPAPLGPEQIAVLGTAEHSAGNSFRSYGYRSLGELEAGYADGIIQGVVEGPKKGIWHAEPAQLKSQQIAGGMSGAAVLDTERNLVVGIVSATWFPPTGSPKDRDTAWAVDARVLTFDPLNLLLRDEPLPRHTTPRPRTVMEVDIVASDLGIAWNNAPAPLPEWVGREELLHDISRDWVDPEYHVTGLIGFGGEGKSSLARRWVDDLLADPLQSQPDGIFWWGFYTKPNVDEFFEAALTYLSSGRLDPRQYPSSSAKAHLIAAMLYTGRYLFVLDGLETLQHQEGDQYGLLKSGDLRKFLRYFAAPGHGSFCLITSRAPVLDLIEYTTYTHRDVTRLGPTDGRALLRKVGVRGPDVALDKVVTDWDGHALTLSLLGAYLVDRHGGDVAYVDEIPPPTADEPRYERVHRVLRRYDDHLTEAEHAFLTLFSAFRAPVHETAFEWVFRADMGADALNAPVVTLDDAAFEAMIERLAAYRILRYDPRARHYMAHPLIRAYYLAHLTAEDRTHQQVAHTRIKDYYLDLAGTTSDNPTLDDLLPLIEVVHHACCAEAYDEADLICWERIYQHDRRVIVYQLGAYETLLTLMLEFFPDGNTTQEPPVGELTVRRFVLNEVGFCLMALGRLSEAVPFFKRTRAIALGMEDWLNASVSYQNLAELYAHLGGLDVSSVAAYEALELALSAESLEYKMRALCWDAWAAHQRGNLGLAALTFRQAEALEREIPPQTQYLFSHRGIQHADHLRRAGDAAYARRVMEANLAICALNHWTEDMSRCYRVLGDLATDGGQYNSAYEHYDQALKIARRITRRDVLIEALLARGRLAARHLRDAPVAFSDLNEALEYAIHSGYRIYEADIRVALSWAHSAARDLATACAEAARARQISARMGYHWGQVDAAEVLAELEGEGS